MVNVFTIVTVCITIPAYGHIECVLFCFTCSTLQKNKKLNFCAMFRIPADPSSALQRSIQLEGSKEGDSSKDVHWRQDIQEMLGSVQDTFNDRSGKCKLINMSESSNKSQPFLKSESSSDHSLIIMH